MNDKQMALVTGMIDLITAIINFIVIRTKAKDTNRNRKHHKHKR